MLLISALVGCRTAPVSAPVAVRPPRPVGTEAGAVSREFSITKGRGRSSIDTRSNIEAEVAGDRDVASIQLVSDSQGAAATPGLTDESTPAERETRVASISGDANVGPQAGDSVTVKIEGLPPSDYTFSMADVLALADQQNPNVSLARERINEAYARVDRAESLWLPSIRAGLNYNHHEGTIQDVAGNVFQTNRSSFYGGMGAGAVGAGSPTVPGVGAQFHLSDAIFQPKIANHQAASRQFAATAARNDVLRDTAVAYLELIRAEHHVAIAQEALDNTRKLAQLTEDYSVSGQGLKADALRMEAEVASRQDQLVSQLEAVQVASARLAQLLHADPSVLIASGEPAVVPLDVVKIENTAAEYVATGLSRRPELAEQKHLVCEATERLRREKYAPLVPSVLLGMSYGGMGGGLGSSIINTGDRWDADAMASWEIRNLGFGERAARDETSSLVRQSQIRELALLDRVAREVTESHVRATRRKQRIEVAQAGIISAEQSFALNQKRIENAQGLPIEVLQAIQALAAARRTYLTAVVDYNVAQFELCHAIGWFIET